MKKNRWFSIKVNKYVSDKSFEVYRPSSLDCPENNTVMFVMERYIQKAEQLGTVNNCLVFWPTSVCVPEEYQRRHAIVLSEYPRKDYIRFMKDNKIYNNPPKTTFKIVDGAYICDGAKIGTRCTIMPGAYLSDETQIGDDVYIGAGVKLMGNIQIGNDVVIRENTVIGADGLTTEKNEDGTPLTMPQFGGVIIEDHVRIGASVVIARGAIDDTLISKGSKIDNSCFISHNVVIGENVLVVGETIVMGSSHIGNNAYLSGNVTVRNKIEIGDEAFVGMGAVVTKSVEKEKQVMGNPARERQ